MAPLTVIRLTAGIVGGLLVLLNGLHLTFGFVRLNQALATESISARLADPLKTGWIISGCVNLILGLVLLWLLPDLASASPVAWKVAVVIALGLVALGLAAVLATGRHFGLLAFSFLGLSLLVPLLLWRSLFHP